MTRYLFYILILLSVVPGCRKDTDDLFKQTADERLRQAIDNYTNVLMQAPGWKLFVYPRGLESQDIEVGGLTYYLTFPDSNRVSMVSDFTVDMASVPKESGFRIKAEQRPSLVFDTYSYIHVAADPDETVSFSPTQEGGYGWGSDFDFSFTELEPGDTIRLKGNFNQSDALMIKATQEEMDNAFNGGLTHIIEATDDFSTSNAFLYLPASDNSKIWITFNLFLYRVNFYIQSGTQLLGVSAPFSHTLDGIHFKNPVSIGGYIFQDAYWDDALQVYYINGPGGRVNITNSNTPLFPFSQAIGVALSTITVPTSPLAGQSTTFANVHETIADNLIGSPYALELGSMDFIFDDESKTMALLVHVSQNGFPFVLQYVYSYTINASGIAQFALLSMNGNAGLVEDEMKPFLDYIDNDVFKLDYYTGSTPALGQFISQDHPSFFFTGNLH